jgi:hypothetical protein
MMVGSLPTICTIVHRHYVCGIRITQCTQYTYIHRGKSRRSLIPNFVIAFVRELLWAFACWLSPFYYDVTNIVQYRGVIIAHIVGLRALACADAITMHAWVAVSVLRGMHIINPAV